MAIIALKNLVDALHIGLKRRALTKWVEIPVLPIQICLAHLRQIPLPAKHIGSSPHSVGIRELTPGIAFRENLLVMNQPLEVTLYVFRQYGQVSMKSRWLGVKYKLQNASWILWKIYFHGPNPFRRDVANLHNFIMQLSIPGSCISSIKVHMIERLLIRPLP